MTREEIMAGRQYLDVNDVMKIFACFKTLAYKTIREIHSVSDIGRRAGRILVKDYEIWLEIMERKERNKQCN